jgi:hypothetical protein
MKKYKNAKKMFDYIYKYNDMDLNEYIELLEQMVLKKTNFHDWLIGHSQVKYEDGTYIYTEEQ